MPEVRHRRRADVAIEALGRQETFENALRRMLEAIGAGALDEQC